MQASLIKALGLTKNPDALDPLAALLKSSNPKTQCSASDALGFLGDQRGIAPLSALLRDANPDVRICATAALSKFSDFTPPPELYDALYDSNHDVRRIASEALANSHYPKAIDALVSSLAPGSPAISALGQSGDPRAVAGLTAFLQNPAIGSSERAEAADSLGKLGGDQAVDALIESLKENNSIITSRASYALGKLQDKRAIEPLRQAYARWSAKQRNGSDSVAGSIAMALHQLGVKEFMPAGGHQP
jgi:HEAT repeat protein